MAAKWRRRISVGIEAKRWRKIKQSMAMVTWRNWLGKMAS